MPRLWKDSHPQGSTNPALTPSVTHTVADTLPFVRPIYKGESQEFLYTFVSEPHFLQGAFCVVIETKDNRGLLQSMVLAGAKYIKGPQEIEKSKSGVPPVLLYKDWVAKVRYTVSTRHLREEAGHLDEIHLAIQSVIYHHMEFGSRFILNDGVSLSLLWDKHCAVGDELDVQGLMALMQDLRLAVLVRKLQNLASKIKDITARTQSKLEEKEAIAILEVQREVSEMDTCMMDPVVLWLPASMLSLMAGLAFEQASLTKEGLEEDATSKVIRRETFMSMAEALRQDFLEAAPQRLSQPSSGCEDDQDEVDDGSGIGI